MDATRLTAAIVLGVALLAGCRAPETTEAPAPSLAPSETPSSAVSADSSTPATTRVWLTDAEWQKRGGEAEGWIPVWFAPDESDPMTLGRYWFAHAGGVRDPAEGMRIAVEATEDPPAGAASAFVRGLRVRAVELREEEVLLDLDAASPGLAAHGSHGGILGSGQLVAITRHYFPDARTLCVALDGRPTDADGPGFLHDMIGCPTAL